MRVEGFSPPPKIAPPSQRSEGVRQRRENSRAGDVVEISPTAQEVSELAARIQLEPREEIQARVQEFRSRAAAGFYDAQEVRTEIAQALIRSDGFKEVVADISVVQTASQKLAQLPEVRQERVDQARQRVNQGFYDTSQIKQETAVRLLDELV